MRMSSGKPGKNCPPDLSNQHHLGVFSVCIHLGYNHPMNFSKLDQLSSIGTLTISCQFPISLVSDLVEEQLSRVRILWASRYCCCMVGTLDPQIILL